MKVVAYKNGFVFNEIGNIIKYYFRYLFLDLFVFVSYCLLQRSWCAFESLNHPLNFFLAVAPQPDLFRFVVLIKNCQMLSSFSLSFNVQEKTTTI